VYPLAASRGGITTGNGDLDLAVANDNQPNRLYHNDGGSLTTSAVYSFTESNAVSIVASGEIMMAMADSTWPWATTG
jgi:hypothetical protein